MEFSRNLNRGDSREEIARYQPQSRAVRGGTLDVKESCPLNPGNSKPNENAYIESWNGKFRDECLNDHWFTSLTHARQVIAAWRVEYNTERTHSSLGDVTPAEFVAAYRQRVAEAVSLTADSKSGPD